MKLKIIVGLLLMASCLASCNRKSGEKEKQGSYAAHDHDHHDHHDHDHDHHDHDHDHDHHNHDHDHDHDHEENLAEGEVNMSDAQFANLALEISLIKPQPFSQTIRTAGQLSTPPGEERVVVANTNGILRFTNKNLAIGTPLNPNESVAVISANQLAEGDAFARTRTDYDLAKSEWERAQSLLTDSLISQRSYNEAKANFERASVAYNALANSTNRQGTTVKSPQRGYIKSIYVNEGSYVETGTPLLSVSSNNRMRLVADLPDRYAGSIGSIRSANFKTSGGQQHYILDQLKGRKISNSQSINPQSPYLQITFEFDYADNLVAGSYVDVYLLGNSIENCIVLPIEALIEEQGAYFVFKKVRDEVYQKVAVTKGFENGQYVQILTGVSEGDAVVSKGAYQLKLASLSASIPHGHTH